MSLFRLLFWGILFYFLYKIFSGVMRLFTGESNQVKGKKKGNPPIDLSKHDVDDADYEDVE